MELPVLDEERFESLWYVTFRGEERYPRGRTYWWDNRYRAPVRYVFQLVLEGAITYEDRTGRYPVLPGDLMLFRHSEPSWYGQPEPLTQPFACRWFSLGGAGISAHAEDLRRRYGSIFRVGLQGAVAKAMTDVMTLVDPRQTSSPTAIAHVIHRFVMAVYEFAEDRADDQLRPVERAVERLRRDPFRAWSLKHLVAESGCSREHFSRVFRDRTGRSPAAFLNEARTRRALTLLRETALPVRVVAEQAGFSSAHALARHVRSVTGYAPDNWRRNHS